MKTTGKHWLSQRLGCMFVFAFLCGCGKMSSSKSYTQERAGADAASAESMAADGLVRHTTTIRKPPPVLGAVFRVEVTGKHATSYEGHLQCAACHSLRPSNPENSKSSHLDEFHQGLRISHGQLSCMSCHHPGDNYSSLRLADGRSIAFEESITLCAQCHGPQYRDYERGAHGGMTGYWDLKRGDRVRNHCQHCHDPHVPNYPKFYPAAAPQDRFQPSHGKEGTSHGH